MEDDAADELHPVGAHAQHPVRRLPAGGKGLGQNVVQRLALGQTGLELVGLGPELLVAQCLVFVGERLDLVHDGGQCLNLPLGPGAKNFVDQTHNFCVLSSFSGSQRPNLTGTVYHITQGEKRGNCK